MKAVAAVVMVVGLTLMSAPVVLPKLGVDLASLLGNATTTPQRTPTAPTSPGPGGVAAIGGAVNDWVGTLGSYLGQGTPAQGTPTEAAPSPADVAKEFAAVCGALSGDGAGCAGGSGGDFAQTFGKAFGMIASGELPESAAATVPAPSGAAPASLGKVPGVSITDAKPGQSRDIGAKFVKARTAGAEGSAP